MDKIVYLIRHGKTDKTKLKNTNNEIMGMDLLDIDEDFIPQIENVSKHLDLNNVKNVYSSNFLRAKRTAQILCKNADIKIDPRLGERKGGIPNLNITPQEYYKMQMDDINFKFPEGESVTEIMKRMYEAIIDILNECKSDKAVVVSHGAAITFLLKKWCDVYVIDVPKKIRRFIYKGKVIHEGVVDFVHCFKLTFDANNNIKNIESITSIGGKE